MHGCGEVVGPAQQAFPNVGRKVVDNVLRDGDPGEQTIWASATHDEQAKTDDRAGFGNQMLEDRTAFLTHQRRRVAEHWRADVRRLRVLVDQGLHGEQQLLA